MHLLTLFRLFTAGFSFTPDIQRTVGAVPLISTRGIALITVMISVFQNLLPAPKPVP